MSHQHPRILSSSTPSELLAYIIAYHTYPTTLLIGCSRTDFRSTLAQEFSLLPSSPFSQNDTPDATKRHIIKNTLLQVAISRHIRIAFIPSVAHLRAYLSVFSTPSSIPPPPALYQTDKSPKKTPLLLFYGFLELHREGSEWSAQGIGISAAALVEAAARSGFQAAVMEPRTADEKTVFEENVPLLNGALQKEDGSWSCRTVPTKRVLGRWFVDHDIRHLI